MEKARVIPKEMVRGVLNDGTQRIAAHIRDTGQRERQNDYGGDAIEDAALYGARVAVHGAELFVRASAKMALRHAKEISQEPDQPCDLPEELRVWNEAAPAGELPAAENPAPPERPAVPETPPKATAFENSLIFGKNPHILPEKVAKYNAKF